MIGKWFLSLVFTGLILASSGCALLSRPEKKPSHDGADLRERQAAKAIRKGENLLAAYQAGNAEKFIAELSPSLRQKVNTRDFKAVRDDLDKNMGKIISWKLLTDLRAPVYRIHIWKVEVERDGSNGKRYRQDVLFRTISGFPKDTEEPYLMSFGFL